MDDRPTDRTHAGIDRAIEQLAFPAYAHLRAGDRLLVCKATGDEWDAFVESENQAFRSKYMTWVEDTEEIFITVLDTITHESFRLKLMFYRIHEPAIDEWFRWKISHDRMARRFQADVAFGPMRKALAFCGAASRQPAVAWQDIQTLRVDVGVTQTWGMEPTELDFKALNIWATSPGAVYILCVHIDPRGHFAASYKLYEVEGNEPPALQEVPTPIGAPITVIRLDARRLLGWDRGAMLPPGFPDPYEIDLYDVLVQSDR